MAEPKIICNVLLSVEADERRRRLQAELGLKMPGLIASALKALEEKIAATTPQAA